MMKILRYIWSAVVNMPCKWLSKCSFCYSCLLFFMQSIASTLPGRRILIWSLWKVQCLIKTRLSYKNRTELLKHNSVVTDVGKQRFLSRGKQFTQGRTTPAFKNGQSSVSYSWILSAVMPVTSSAWTVSKVVQPRAHVNEKTGFCDSCCLCFSLLCI